MPVHFWTPVRSPHAAPPMATFRLPHLSAPSVLRAVDREPLLRFLAPYRPYLAARGADLPAPGTTGRIPYESLVAALMAPDADTPADLVEALYYVDGMATPEGMHALLAVAAAAGLALDGADLTPAEVAVQVWLAAPDRLERAHAEQHLPNPRSFEYFQTDASAPAAAPALTPDVTAALEGEMNDWFAANRRGRTARVFAFPRPDVTWFLVRHGEPFKREEAAAADAEPGSVAYRPLRYDVVAYDPALGELRVSARLKGEKDLYRAAFGLHLFGRADYFPDALKYTLEPLRAAADAALVCADVPGLEWVRLREIHFAWGGAQAEYEIVRAADVFAAFRDRGRAVPDRPKLARAVFQVKPADARRPRAVTIKPPNVALYARDHESPAVEAWLRARGFLDVYPAA
ncbi:hypothetical protein [Urbifossiella limnaea]|nr:hypothetical protein [Urbifossiella limnaea]